MSHYTVPSHIFVGKDALLEAEPYIKSLGHRAFIVTGKHVGKSPMYEKLIQSLERLELAHRTFDGITGEPTVTMIEAGVELYKKSNCDFCIGIGGGSPLDAAKAIALMSVSQGKITDYVGKLIVEAIAPVIEIPTTAGTGSEVTMFTIITDAQKEIKMLLKGPSLVPTMAIVDPDFSMDMPRPVTAATGLDAFTHAVEAFTSRKAFSMTDNMAISAIKRIVSYLPMAYRNGYDAKAREEMSIAALEAGICINNSSVTLVHGMSRPIGALFHVPHGISNAMLLRECIAFALDGAYEKFAILGREVGAASKEDSDQVAAERFLTVVDFLCKACDVLSLKEYGIEEEKYLAMIDKMATDAMASGSPSNTIKPVTKEDCINLYHKVYNPKGK